MTKSGYVAILFLLGAGWGLSQPLGKLATSTGYQPFGLIFWQLVICTLVLGGITLARGARPAMTPAALRFYVVVAVLGTLVPNATFYTTIRYLPSGVMSIITSAVPLLAFPMALALRLDKFDPRRLIGLLIGLVAVLILAAPGAALPDAAAAAWLPLALVGPLFYAAEGTYVQKVGLAGMDPVAAMAGASLVGMLLCLPVTLGLGQWINPLQSYGLPEWSLILSSVIHALMYAGYVWLASAAGAVFAAQCSYIITGTGIFWAMLLLGERFSPFLWLSLVLLLCGVALVNPRAKDQPTNG